MNQNLIKKLGNEAQYIGDGLYASFDGYHIWIRSCNGVEILNEVALEPHVFDHLVEYRSYIQEKTRKPD
jgi:hypothetical protein